MARTHARIWLDINGDDDFEALPFDAQGLYCRVILTLDDLNACGVATWRPRKLTTKAPDLTYPRILEAASALEVGRYCLFDLDTEEVLARSYIRRDELLRNPTMAAAVVKAYNGIASKTLRAAVVTELLRVRQENPEYSSWTAKIKTYDVGKDLSKLLAKPAFEPDTYTDQIQVPITNTDPVSIGNTWAVGKGNTEPVPDTPTDPGSEHQSKSVGNPYTFTNTSTPAPLEGLRSKGTHQGDDPGPEPRSTCQAHPNGTTQPCRACADARHQWNDWDTNRRRNAERQRHAFLAEIDACDACDEHGWIEQDDSVSRCPKHNWEHAHA